MGGRSLFGVECDRFLGCGGAIACWECGNAIAKRSVGIAFWGCERAIAKRCCKQFAVGDVRERKRSTAASSSLFWGVGVRSLEVVKIVRNNYLLVTK